MSAGGRGGNLPAASTPDYDAVRQSRGWSWERMAAEVRKTDPATADRLLARKRPQGTERAVNRPPETR